MKCTIVSCYPQKIEEERNGIYPGRFNIPACKRGDVQVLVIGDSKSYVDMGEDRPALERPYASDVIADGLVEDLLRAKPEVRKGEQQPCIFWLEGEFTAGEVTNKHKDKLEQHLKMQEKWFYALIQNADSDWAKNPGSHRAITDDAKKGAAWLGLDKPWALDLDTAIKTLQCPFCMINISDKAIICANCKQVVNKAAYDKLTGVTAEKK